MYQEIKPSEGLHTIIDTFWTFSNNEEPENFKVLPDTCTDLIFDLNQNEGFISGAMSCYQFKELTAKSNLFGIRFKTEKFGCISKIPLNETKNSTVEISQIFTKKEQTLLNQINDLETITSKKTFLEKFITTSFIQNSQRQDLLIISVAQHIRALKGVVIIKNIADSNHISLRQLERRFKNYMGLTLKEFSNIVRFTTTKKAITTFSKTSLLEIAFDFGYFDHAHMNYDFKRISGENPSGFR